MRTNYFFCPLTLRDLVSDLSEHFPGENLRLHSVVLRPGRVFLHGVSHLTQPGCCGWLEFFTPVQSVTNGVNSCN